MLLSYNKLCDLVSKKVITDVKKSQINASSIDITLGKKILVEDCRLLRTVSLRKRNALKMQEVILEENMSMVLAPGQFILAHSEQIFNLPNNISAEYKLKSSMARIGLEHLTAGWCDAGWNGSVLTLELKNMSQSHYIELQPGDAIGQVVFFEHEAVPDDRSYAARGRYNGDKEVKGHQTMKTAKRYDYYLIIWKRGEEEIHEPACFQEGADVKGWCDIMLDRANNTRDDRAAKYTSYKIYRLIPDWGLS